MKYIILWAISVHIVTLVLRVKKPDFPIYICDRIADLRDWFTDAVEQLKAPVSIVVALIIFSAVPVHAYNVLKFDSTWKCSKDQWAEHLRTGEPPHITVTFDMKSDAIGIARFSVWRVVRTDPPLHVFAGDGDGMPPGGHEVFEVNGVTSSDYGSSFDVQPDAGYAEQYVYCFKVNLQSDNTQRCSYYYAAMNIDPACIPHEPADSQDNGGSSSQGDGAQRFGPFGGDGWPGSAGPNGPDSIDNCGSPLSGDVAGYHRSNGSGVTGQGTTSGTDPFAGSAQSRPFEGETNWGPLSGGCDPNAFPGFHFSNKFWDWPGDLISNFAKLLHYLFIPPQCTIDSLKNNLHALITYGPLGFPEQMMAAYNSGAGCPSSPSYVFQFFNPADFINGCNASNSQEASTISVLMRPSGLYPALPGMPSAAALLPTSLDCTSMAPAIRVARSIEKVLLWFFGLWALARRVMVWASGLNWTGGESAFVDYETADQSYARTMRNL